MSIAGDATETLSAAGDGASVVSSRTGKASASHRGRLSSDASELVDTLPPGVGLHELAEKGDANLLKRWLEINGYSEVNSIAPGGHGRTALLLAALSGHHKSMMVLLEAMASADLVDDYGYTPLHYAVEHRHFDCMEVLASSGINLDVGGDVKVPLRTGELKTMMPGHEMTLPCSTRLWTDIHYEGSDHDVDLCAVVFYKDRRDNNAMVTSCYNVEKINECRRSEKPIRGVMPEDGPNAPTSGFNRCTPWIELCLQELAADNVKAVFLVARPICTGSATDPPTVSPSNSASLSQPVGRSWSRTQTMPEAHFDTTGVQHLEEVTSRKGDVKQETMQRTALVALKKSKGPDPTGDAVTCPWLGGGVKRPALRIERYLGAGQTETIASVQPSFANNLGSHREMLLAVVHREQGVETSHGASKAMAGDPFSPWCLRMVLEPIPGAGPALRPWPEIIKGLSTTFPLERRDQKIPGEDAWSRRAPRLTCPPLVMGAHQGDRVTLSRLLDLKASVNIQDCHGRTPLMAAVRAGHHAVVEELLKGESTDSSSMHRQRPDMWLLDRNGHAALHLAAEGQRLHLIEDLVTSRADVNQRSTDGCTPLFLVNNRSAAEALLNLDADINPSDNMKNTPLIHMCTHQKWDIVQLLLDRNADVLEMNMQGQSALLVAAECDNKDMLKKLMEKGAGMEVFGAVAAMSGLSEDRIKETVASLGLGPRSVLDRNSFTETWTAFGFPKELSQSFYKALDKNGDGFIEFSELLGLGILVSKDVEGAADFFFKVFDADSSGFVDHSEFERVVEASLKLVDTTLRCTLVKWLVQDTEDSRLKEEHMNQNQGALINELFQSVDKDSDNTITREEFLKAAKNKRLRQILFPLASSIEALEKTADNLERLIPSEEVPKVKKDGTVECRIS